MLAERRPLKRSVSKRAAIRALNLDASNTLIHPSLVWVLNSKSLLHVINHIFRVQSLSSQAVCLDFFTFRNRPLRPFPRPIYLQCSWTPFQAPSLLLLSVLMMMLRPACALSMPVRSMTSFPSIQGKRHHNLGREALGRQKVQYLYLNLPIIQLR